MKFTTSDGLQLAYEGEGEGPVLLCLPGLTRNARDFDDLAAVIDGVRLLRLTYRGRGNSDRDPNFLNYNVGREAKDVVELLDHLGIEQVVTIGTSRGGLISMLLAVIAKDRLAGVVLNDIGPEIDTAGLGKLMGYLGLTPKMKTYGEAAKVLRETMQAGFPDLSDADWETQARRWFDQGADGLMLNYDPKLRDATLEQAKQPTPDLWPWFDALAGVPLALIHGENSDFMSDVTAAKMRARRPDMVYAKVPDRGHVPLLNEVESLAAIHEILEQAK